MKKQDVRLNLGSVIIDRDLWDYFIKRGYSREDIREIIVQNGEESLASHMHTGDIDDKVEDDEN